jgi:uncharacterized delta-60 repeat protein
MKTLLLYLTLVSLACCQLSANQPGAHDASFKTGSGPSEVVKVIARQRDGKVIIAGDFATVHNAPRLGICRLLSSGLVDLTFNPGSGINGRVNAIVIQSDGRIIIGGLLDAYNGRPCENLVRLNANGSLDTTYQADDINGEITAMTLQPDGKLLLGGMFTNVGGPNSAGVARLNSDGTADTSFLSGFTSGREIDAIALAADGRIYLAGDFSIYGTIVASGIARLLTNGDPDSTFLTGPIISTGASCLTVQKDGKLLAGGNFIFSITLRHLVRFNLDGSVDETFPAATTPDDEVTAIGLQTDGRIIIGGRFQTVGGTAARHYARLKTDGTLDSTHLGGTRTDDYVRALHVHTDNRVLIAGGFFNYNGVGRNGIARIRSDGLVDTAFSTSSAADREVLCVARQADGKIIIGGNFTQFNGSPVGGIARLKTDGTLDTTFQTGSGANNDVSAVAVQADGKVLLGGDFTSFNGGSHGRIVRLTSTGSVDPTFSPGIGANADVEVILIQPDGKILVGGLFTQFNAQSAKSLIRLLSDGSVDSSFSVGDGANDRVLALALRPDGRILVGGDFFSFDFGFTRNITQLLPNGNTDSSFLNTIEGTNGPVKTLALLPDGDVMLGGDFSSYDNATHNRLVRINPNGTVDNSFNAGAGPDDSVNSIVVQPDGALTIGGDFTQYRSAFHNRIARLQADGRLESSFDSGEGLDGSIEAMLPTADGKLIAVGSFTRYDKATANHLVRIFHNYVHVATTFTGITTGTQLSSIGLFSRVSISLTTSGSFSGSLTIGAERVTLTGSFNRYGQAFITPLRKDKSLLFVDLALRRGEKGGAVVLGHVSDHLGRAVSLVAHAPYHSSTKLPAVTLAGKHLVALPTGPSVLGALPVSGTGYLTCTVSTSGTVTVVGRAPDGTSLTSSSRLSQTGDLLLHLPLYSSLGFINGTLSMDEESAKQATTGNLFWSRPPNTTYPTGFAQILAVEGQRYIAAPTGVASFVNPITVRISGGHLPAIGLSSLAAVGSTNIVIITSGSLNSLKLTLNRTTGTFSGSFIPPGATKSVTIQGIILNSSKGQGYCLINIGGVTLPSAVLINPDASH